MVRLSHESLKTTLSNIRRTGSWRMPLFVFLVSAIVLGTTSWNHIVKPSADPHFAYLAATYNVMIADMLGSEDAAKKRKNKVAFELDKRPPHGNDWASYTEVKMASGETVKGTWLDKPGKGRFKLLDGSVMLLDAKQLRGAKRTKRFFVSFPPGPAVMMMPLVAVFGYKLNDVIVTVLFGALNVMLMFILLRRLSVGGRTGRARSDNLWLCILFGFGTAHYWCSVLGQVWFTALIIGCTFSLLFLIFAIDGRRPFWAGVFCAAGFATRTPLLFASIFFYLMVMFPGGKLRRNDWGDAFKKIALFSLPCLVVGITLLYMNHVRFGSFTEFGHTYLAGGGLGRIKTYGLFNFQFLSKNLAALFTLVPRFQPTAPFIVVSKHGMSILMATPALLYLVWPKRRISSHDIAWHRIFWIAIIAIAIPHILYQNTGYEQYSYRFSLDYTPYLVVLLASGGREMTRVFKGAILAGVAVNLFGAITFKRFGQFFSNEFFP